MCQFEPANGFAKLDKLLRRCLLLTGNLWQPHDLFPAPFRIERCGSTNEQSLLVNDEVVVSVFLVF
jgi:hypothetical protein